MSSVLKRPTETMHGTLISADFPADTITLEMEPGYYTAKMRFAVVPADEYRQLDDECQIHRGAHLVIDQIVMGAGVFEVEVDGGLEPAWENTSAAVRQLAEQRAELLEALQWYVENDDTNIGQQGNEFWELGLDRARAAIANATQQRNATGGEG